MVVENNVNRDLNCKQISEYIDNVVCEQIDRPVGRQVYVCRNTEKGEFWNFVF